MQENDPHEIIVLRGRASSLPIHFPIRLYTLLILLMLAGSYHATLLPVSKDGSMEFTYIQAAIASACDMDTILVYPGRYTENIDYLGKSITVCSLEAITGDSLYIQNTIIDGEKNGPCVAMINNEQNATLQGFCVRNGSGLPIFAEQLKSGGGVLIQNANQIHLTNCIITDNTAATGAGIFSFNSSISMSGLIIHDNYALVQGGGIVLYGMYNSFPTIVFDPVNRCSVYSNYGANPVDIWVADILANLEINLDIFTLATPDRFYYARHYNTPLFYSYTDTVNINRAFRTEVSSDLYVSTTGSDDNSGLSPAQAMRSITKAIHRIAADSLNVHTIYVLPGVYHEVDTAQVLPIPLKSDIRIVGAGSDDTEIVASGNVMRMPATIMCGTNCRNISLRGFKLSSELPEANAPLSFNIDTSNVHIDDISINNMKVLRHGVLFVSNMKDTFIDSLVVDDVCTDECVIYIGNIISGSMTNSTFNNINSSYSDPYTPGDDSWSFPVIDISVTNNFVMENCKFQNISVLNNQYTWYLGYHQYNSDAVADITVNNCLFSNIRTNWHAGVYFSNDHLGNYTVSNCTFYDNYGCFGAVALNGKVSMRNCILYNPDASDELFVFPPHPQDTGLGIADCDYCNIRGGLGSVLYNSGAGNFVWGEHNLSQDPGFLSTDPLNSNFLKLGIGSGCINTGTPDTTSLHLPPYDLAGNQRIWGGCIDMGCYEYDSEPWVGIDDPYISPAVNASMDVYPNPFNDVTTVKTILPGNRRSGSASVCIYNIKGQKIRSIELDPGKSEADYRLWDGRDEHGKACASGVYIISLLVDKLPKLCRKVTLIR